MSLSLKRFDKKPSQNEMLPLHQLTLCVCVCKHWRSVLSEKKKKMKQSWTWFLKFKFKKRQNMTSCRQKTDERCVRDGLPGVPPQQMLWRMGPWSTNNSRCRRAVRQNVQFAVDADRLTSLSDGVLCLMRTVLDSHRDTTHSLMVTSACCQTVLDSWDWRLQTVAYWFATANE